jgi:hypothetical protein
MKKRKTRSPSSADAYSAPPESLFVDPTSRPEYVPGFEWNAEEADKPRRFIEKCCRHRAEGGEIVRVSPIPWFRDRVLFPLFGWRRPNGRLRFRRFSVFVPKKNRKTTSCSQIVQFANVVAGMDVFLAANVKDQARTMWRMVRDSIQASPILEPVFDVVDHKYLIRNKRNGKEIRCLSADAKVSEGINGLVLLDEIHSFKKPDLVDTIMYATRGIPNAIIGSISTAGDNRNGIGWEWWEATELVLKDPSVNPSLLGEGEPGPRRGFHGGRVPQRLRRRPHSPAEVLEVAAVLAQRVDRPRQPGLPGRALRELPQAAAGPDRADMRLRDRRRQQHRHDGGVFPVQAGRRVLLRHHAVLGP